jgi:hypothetical protein
MTILGSPSVFAATAPTIAADSRTAQVAQPLFYRIGPPAMIAIGLGLTAAWTGLLVYGLVSLITLAF